MPPYHQLILLVNFSTSFTHFHTRLLILFLYILDTRPLLAMWFVNIFSQTIGCLFNLFNNISCRTKVFDSNKIQFTDFFFFFFLVNHELGRMTQNISHTLGLTNFLSFLLKVILINKSIIYFE